MFEALETA